MSIEYEAVFGLGVEVKPIIPKTIEKEYESFSEYFDDLEHQKYTFEVAGNFFSGDFYYYIFIKDPIYNGESSIGQSINELYIYLEEIGFEYEGKADIIGRERVS